MRGKESRKKQLDCIIIDEDQFENEKEFRRLGRPKRTMKVEQPTAPVIEVKSKPKETEKPSPPPAPVPVATPVRKPVVVSEQLPKLNSSHSSRKDFVETMWRELPEKARQRCVSQLQAFRKELSTENTMPAVQTYKDAAQRIFACIAQGVEELKLAAPENPTELQKELLSLNDHYSFVRQLSLRIEQLLREAYSSLDPNHPNGYPSRFSTLHRNLKCDSNKELRRKILSGVMNCQQLVAARQEELWSTERRQEKEQQEKKFFQSRRIELPNATDQKEEESQIDYGLPQPKAELRKRVESCEESLDVRIMASKENLWKQMAKIESEWPQILRQDLPPLRAEELANHFKAVLYSQSAERQNEQTGDTPSGPAQS